MTQHTIPRRAPPGAISDLPQARRLEMALEHLELARQNKARAEQIGDFPLQLEASAAYAEANWGLWDARADFVAALQGCGLCPSSALAFRAVAEYELRFIGGNATIFKIQP